MFLQKPTHLEGRESAAGAALARPRQLVMAVVAVVAMVAVVAVVAVVVYFGEFGVSWRRWWWRGVVGAK